MTDPTPPNANPKTLGEFAGQAAALGRLAERAYT
jgi:hypothetical protein